MLCGRAMNGVPASRGEAAEKRVTGMHLNQVDAGAPLPFIPAQAGIHSHLLTARDRGPRFRGKSGRCTDSGFHQTGTRARARPACP